MKQLTRDEQILIYYRRQRVKKMKEEADKKALIEFRQQTEKDLADKRLKLVEHLEYQKKD